MHALGDGFCIVALERLVGIALTGKIDGDDVKARGEDRHHFAPGEPALRVSGKQNQRGGPLVICLDAAEAQAVERLEAMA